MVKRNDSKIDIIHLGANINLFNKSQMNLNQKEINIKLLVKDYSIETTPNVYQNIGELKKYLPY